MSKTLSGKLECFLITSQGHCATSWLAKTLNLHPDIYCSHGIGHPIISVERYHLRPDSEVAALEWTELLLADLEKAKFGLDKPLKDTLERMAKEQGVTLPDIPSRDPTALSSYIFDELALWFADQLAANPHTCFIGNVHGVTITNYMASRSSLDEPAGGRFGDEEPVVVDLIRHPVSRFQSALNRGVGQYRDPMFRAEVDQAISERTDQIRQIEQEFKIDMSKNDLKIFFFYTSVININRSWADEIANYDCPRVLIEDITQDRTHLGALIDVITRGRAETDDAYFDHVYSSEHLLSGRKSGKGPPPGPEECFAGWNAWQQTVFKNMIAELSLDGVYAPYGYDFSFV